MAPVSQELEPPTNPGRFSVRFRPNSIPTAILAMTWTAVLAPASKSDRNYNNITVRSFISIPQPTLTSTLDHVRGKSRGISRPRMMRAKPSRVGWGDGRHCHQANAPLEGSCRPSPARPFCLRIEDEARLDGHVGGNRRQVGKQLRMLRHHVEDVLGLDMLVHSAASGARMRPRFFARRPSCGLHHAPRSIVARYQAVEQQHSTPMMIMPSTITSVR